MSQEVVVHNVEGVAQRAMEEEEPPISHFVKLAITDADFVFQGIVK
jgi:hypothetical protein